MFTDAHLTALGRGFALMSTALDNNGHNCNPIVQAESLMMAKERLVEQYGPIRYTIGIGCSGGSITQNTVANAYPGIYQGLVTSCTYADSLTTAAQFADYHLLRKYFEDPTYPCRGVSDEERYHPETNPGGARCSVVDMMGNQLGARPEDDWTPQEHAAGHGFTGLPLGNAGVQYGLDALRRGWITPAQFVDLNTAIGGLTIDIKPQAPRTAGDMPALRNAYRTGAINTASNLARVAIINHGGPDPGIAHDYAHAFWTRARLEREHGHFRNHVMWFGAMPGYGDPSWPTEAMLEMDRWLTTVEADDGTRSLPEKIVAGRPDGLQDRCSNLPGLDHVVLPGLGKVCEEPLLQTHFGTPPTVAGEGPTSDTNACTLRPLRATDYHPRTLSAKQLATLRSAYPDGVCDYSEPGVGAGDTLRWLTYQGPGGDVVTGGNRLGAAPDGSGTGWTSAAFGSWRNG